MSAMFFLVLVSLLVATGFLIAFLWAVKNGQFEDKFTPKVRILLDDKENSSENELNLSKSKEN